MVFDTALNGKLIKFEMIIYPSIKVYLLTLASETKILSKKKQA